VWLCPLGCDIHSAIQYCQLEVLKILLISGFVNIDVTDQAGETPLMRVVVRNSPDIVRVLLAKGADISIKRRREEQLSV